MAYFLLSLIDKFFGLMYGLFFARFILSWIPYDFSYRQQIEYFLRQATEWFLEPIRRIIPPMGMIDISFIVGFILLGVLKNLLTALVVSFFG